MPNSILKLNDSVLLFPEDLPSLDTSAYYRVTALGSMYVTLQPTGASHSTGAVQLLREEIADRKVPKADESRGYGLWVRKAICYRRSDDVSYGQVISYEREGLIVRTGQGEESVPKRSVIYDVFPVVAMLMWQRPVPGHWSKRQLGELHDSLMEAILDGGASDLVSRVQAVLDGLGFGIPSVDSQLLKVFDWVEPLTGVQRKTTLQHVIDHVFYISGGNEIPVDFRRRIGGTFCQDPAVRTSPTLAHAPNEAENALFAPSDAPSESSQHEGMQLGVSPSFEEVSLPTDESRNATAPANVEADKELLSLLKGKPHLLVRYLELQASRPESRAFKRQGSDGLEATLEHGGIQRGPKRTKYEFSPTQEQVRVHELITAPSFRGKSPSEFVELVVTSNAVQFAPLPSTRMRAYSLEIGTSRELSLMHFKRMGHYEWMERLRTGEINMVNFSASVKMPRAATPHSMSDVISAATSLLHYCSVVADETTVRVVSVLLGFLTEFEGWGLLPENELPLFVYWVDNQLGWYRTQCALDLNSGSDLRSSVVTRFSMSNGELQNMLHTVNLRRPSSVLSLNEQLTFPRREAKNTIPAEVYASLPSQQGKTVCLKFLSKLGCRGGRRLGDCPQNKARSHFIPPSLSEGVKKHISLQWGGLSTEARHL